MSPLAIAAPTLRIELANDLAESRRAALAAREYLSGSGWDEATVLDCELALVEACNNAIRYSKAPFRPAVLEIECRPGEIEMRIMDHSVGFEWPAEVVLPGPESESGRGLYIIHAVMDQVKYRRGEDDNALILRRSRRE